ncbi:MAG: diguanylate cyclase [Chloroflexi bacterium]|nr:diguanylate cyclase [Chloroflexota bacterium]
MTDRMRRFVRRWGVARATAIGTAAAVLLSLLITVAVSLVMDSTPGPLGWGLSVFSPLLIAPPLAYLQFRLIERLDRAERELAELASYDDLTQTYNRRQFTDMALKVLAAAGQSGMPVGCLMLDVDHFKQVNDRFGHLAGDEALKAIAVHLRQFAQPPVLLGRFGGDEFLFLLPGTDETEARAFAERMRNDLSALRIPTRHGLVQVTVSIGVFVTRAVAGDLEHFLHHADNALYAAKGGGRNRVEVGREG